jgi:hypothetical protein
MTPAEPPKHDQRTAGSSDDGPADPPGHQRLFQLAAAAVALLIVAVVLVLVLDRGSSHRPLSTSTTTKAGQEAALLDGPAPWPAQNTALAGRLALLHLPEQSDVAYHEHAVLRIYLNGKRITVPAEIGIDQQSEYLAALHTHDQSGVIHMEASEPYPFTLGQFFVVWGVKFTRAQIGGYRDGGGNTLAVYVDGHPIKNAPRYVIRPHDRIVVDFGRSRAFVRNFHYSWPAGL